MATQSKPKPPSKSGVDTPKISLRNSLTDSIAAANWLTEADIAATTLAYKLCDQVDKDGDLHAARLLLATLEQIGLTTKGRRGQHADIADSPLDELRRKAEGKPNPTARNVIDIK
jgi:hypothetical protein